MNQTHKSENSRHPLVSLPVCSFASCVTRQKGNDAEKKTASPFEKMAINRAERRAARCVLTRETSDVTGDGPMRRRPTA